MSTRRGPVWLDWPAPAPGSFKKGTTVYATYTCTDDTSGAGVVLCGTSIFGTESTYSTRVLKTKLNTGSSRF